jgi:signal transduction histidine kinase
VEAAQYSDSMEEATEALDTVERQTDRLIQLAEDLLVLSRLDNSHNLVQKTCQLNVVVADLVKNLSALKISTGIHLEVVIQAATPIHVQMADAQAHRLLTNLMINALQHTSPGGTVTVILSQVKNYAVIQVQDTGIGIPTDVQAHIFDRFYRINQARTRDKGGAGLGLAIVKGIVQSHQGSIEVKSKPGEGSNFIVNLPLTRSK